MAMMRVEMDERIIDKLKRTADKYKSQPITNLDRETTRKLIEALGTAEPIEEEEDVAMMRVEIDERIIDKLRGTANRYESYSFTKLDRDTTRKLIEALEWAEPAEEKRSEKLEKERERPKFITH